MHGNYRTLVLAVDYRPYDIIPWTSAFIKTMREDNPAFMVEAYKNKFARDGSGNEYEIPAVIATTHKVAMRKPPKNVRRRDIYARDRMRCQYCQIELTSDSKTIDHIIPQCRFKGKKETPHTFENMVASCKKCNTFKGNRTPEEAGMPLITKPKPISVAEAFYLKFILNNIPDEWKIYVNKF